MTARATLLTAVVAVAAAVIAVVALTRPSGREHPNEAGARTAPAAAPDVAVRRTRLGRILVDRRGHTLYLFRADSHGSSHCSGGCARVWPPLIVSGRPQGGPGILKRKLETTRRKDDSLQVVYNGHPLYAMTADTSPGQTEGQGFLGTWFAVAPSGRQIGKARRGKGGY